MLAPLKTGQAEEVRVKQCERWREQDQGREYQRENAGYSTRLRHRDGESEGAGAHSRKADLGESS